MWMNPPSVYEVTIPRSHNTTNITKIVQSIWVLLPAIQAAIACASLEFSWLRGPPNDSLSAEAPISATSPNHYARRSERFGLFTNAQSQFRNHISERASSILTTNSPA
jgi:hypothetical protein